MNVPDGGLAAFPDQLSSAFFDINGDNENGDAYKPTLDCFTAAAAASSATATASVVAPLANRTLNAETVADSASKDTTTTMTNIDMANIGMANLDVSNTEDNGDGNEDARTITQIPRGTTNVTDWRRLRKAFCASGNALSQQGQRASSITPRELAAAEERVAGIKANDLRAGEKRKQRKAKKKSGAVTKKTRQQERQARRPEKDARTMTMTAEEERERRKRRKERRKGKREFQKMLMGMEGLAVGGGVAERERDGAVEHAMDMGGERGKQYDID